MDIKMKVRGGLGNQLFQYAFAKKLSKKYVDAKISMDISYFNKKHIRNLEISKLKLDPKICFNNHENKLISFLYLLYRIIDRIYSKFVHDEFKQPLILLKFGLWFSGKEFSCDNIKVLFGKIYLCGYFQNVCEIDEVRSEIRREVLNSISDDVDYYLKEIMNGTECLGVSIRCGDDYEKFGWPICTREYYINAIKQMVMKYHCKTVFIFADNIHKVMNENWFSNFQNLDIVYVENLTVIESLQLLAMCSYHIISNSTFAWWGAYLSDDEKQIVSPKFFYPGIEMKNTGLAMKNMIYLDNFTGEENT